MKQTVFGVFFDHDLGEGERGKGGGGQRGDKYPLWVPCHPQPLIQSVKQDGGIFRRLQGVR